MDISLEVRGQKKIGKLAHSFYRSLYTQDTEVKGNNEAKEECLAIVKHTITNKQMWCSQQILQARRLRIPSNQ